MEPINNNKRIDIEAKALAACYRLLLQKAAERHARLAKLADSGCLVLSPELADQEAERGSKQ